MAESQSRLVPARVFQSFSVQALTRCGMPQTDAEILTDTLLQASLRGTDTHGIAGLPLYARRVRAGTAKAKTTIKVVRENASTALVDGQDGMGQVVAYRAMEVAIRKALDSGIGLVGVRNSGHFGAAAYYPMMALKQDLIGMTVSNGYARVAPWGGYERVANNTPWSVAIPAGEEEPIVLDMANSVVAFGKVRVAAERGEAIPLGWALTAAGVPTEDPRAALAGTVLPMAGYKGYAMIVVFEVLSAALTGALFTWDVGLPRDPNARSGVGHVMAAIDVERFVPLSEFRQRVDELQRKYRNSGKRPGFDAIMMPGEPEAKAKRQREEAGIPTLQVWIDDLRKLGEEVGIPFPM